MNNNIFIIATAYKNPFNPDLVKEMITSGADVIRIKFAHINTNDILVVLHQLKNLISTLGTSTKILVDMPENKIRLGGLDEKKEKIYKDREYRMCVSNQSHTINEFIPLQWKDLNKNFSVGDELMIGDGELSFVVSKIVSVNEIQIKFLNDGILGQYRSIISSDLLLRLDNCQPVLDSISLLDGIFPDYLGLSFVDSADYIKKVKAKIVEVFGSSWQPKLMAKIESADGLKNIDEIMDEADIVVVARGDLSLTTDFTEMILRQKEICKLGIAKNKPVVVATQILESCLDNNIPKNSDIADLTNILLDGAQGVWFSKETAHNDNPGKVIKITRQIIDKVKKYEKF